MTEDDDIKITTRDNFTARVKKILAERVGNHCSNPDCMRSTSCPSSDEEKAINVGEASHITAAAEGGPRYDPNLSAEARCHISNGIWLCRICAVLIDRDKHLYPIERLRKWKLDAEERARQGIITSPTVVSSSVMIVKLDEADKLFLQGLALSPEDDIESITSRMRESALIDITTFRNARTWPSYVIPLNLTLLDTVQKNVTLNGMAECVKLAENLCLISPPGTGKTTTLVQLAETILNSCKTIAVLVPMGEWSDRSETFFEFLVRRNAFCSFQTKHFMQLAYFGRLVLLLDGWNELEPAARVRAERDLSTLRREFSLLGTVISTRQHALPISGVAIQIEGLSENQQLELARKYRGAEGEALLDEAWRIPGLRELITIPLYFNALLSSTQTSKLPETKNEILNIFVTQHENAPAKAEILRKELLSFHKEILVGLAVEANYAARTTLSDKNARRAVSKTMKSLQDEDQLTASLQPTNVLDVLVSTHSLIRSSTEAGSIAFQQQQFQEWYASFEVERLMLEATQGNKNAHKILRNDILNWIAWEESVLFACERLSRKDNSGAKVVATVTLDALTIDPMLAAEIIYRSSAEIWPYINEKIVSFVNRWHKPGSVDRAVRFMIISGRPDFSEQIWPLFTNPDGQIYLATLRIAQQFRPSVLGPDAKKRLAALPEDIRRHVIAEIGQRSGYDGMELAADLAKTDQSPQVVIEILQSLQFRRADRHVKDILQTASDEVWQLVVSTSYPDKLLDPSLDAKLTEMRQALVTKETDPIRIVSYLTENGIERINAEEYLMQLIQSPDFPIKNNQAGIAIEKAFKMYPHAVVTAILQRIATGLQLPYGIDELLENTATIDDGPIVTIAFDKTTPEAIARAAYSILGPISVGCMIDELFILHEKFHLNGKQLNQPEQKEYQRLTGAILTSRQASFLTALFERSDIDQLNRIEFMTDLLARHGKSHENMPLIVSDDISSQLTNVLEQWIKIALNSPNSNRHQFPNILRAIERLPKTRFVPDIQKMLERDLTEWAHAREKHFKSGKGGILTPDVTHSYTLQYRRTFSAIGDDSVVTLMKDYLPDLRFGYDAACVLLDIWNRQHPSGKDKRFTSWHDFSEAKARRVLLHDALQSPPTCDFAEWIFEVIRKLDSPNKDSATQQHVIKLAKIGLRMPYGIKHSEIDMLLTLHQKFSTKQALLTAAAIAGEIVPANILVAGLEELLEDAKKDAWRLDENQGELMGWIELFAFSDQPIAVLEAIDLLPAELRHTWRLHRLLAALGKSPNEEALQVLEALAQREPQITQKWEWLNALIQLETESSAYALLNLLCEGTLAKNRDSLSNWRLSEQLANLAQKFPLLRDDMLQRYEKMTDGQAKEVLEAALIEGSDTQILLKLIRSNAENNQQHDYKFTKAIENIAVGKRPTSNWPGAFEQFSLPLIEFRKQLFDMLTTDDAQSSLAEACLIKIENLRDEHGRMSDEPRHPDILSGRPWPKEVNETP